MEAYQEVVLEWPEAVDEWPEKDHDDPNDVDQYPSYHPTAGNIGRYFFGDVCPFCGTPIAWDEEVRLDDGRTGIIGDLLDVTDHDHAAYHPKCYRYREGELSADITDY